MKELNVTAMALLLGLALSCLAAGELPKNLPPMVKKVLDNTTPLKYPRQGRLPLYLWQLVGVAGETDAETEALLRALDARGLALFSTWDHGNKEKSLEKALSVARIQKKLGLKVNVNANPLLYSFFNGDPQTAHVAADGGKFFDPSFDPGSKIGCPFSVKFRYPEIKARIEYFADAYKKQGVPVDFIFADWEIDGPSEWNGAWEASKRCTRCRQNIKKIEDFGEFQKALRIIRSEMQRVTYAEPIKARFPKAMVGNYGVYPNDGYRYWFDYYETMVEGAPYRADQKAEYRRWFQEFPLTGYTFAMPVVYTWAPIYVWYDFKNTDYRWFYNMLLCATNACKSTSRKVPVISFVHWHSIVMPPNMEFEVKQFSEEKYEELLWHMLLRRTDGLFLWCTDSEAEEEIRLLHKVYADSLEYAKYLEKGTPISFDVPEVPGPVVSGFRLKDKLLVRRTDFDDNQEPVKVRVRGRTVLVPRLDGKCQVISLK